MVGSKEANELQLGAKTNAKSSKEQGGCFSAPDAPLGESAPNWEVFWSGHYLGLSSCGFLAATSQTGSRATYVPALAYYCKTFIGLLIKSLLGARGRWQ